MGRRPTSDLHGLGADRHIGKPGVAM